MKKKITACILVLALLTALLAGCTEKADPTDAETTERTPPSGSAVTAKNLEALGNEKSEVVMLILLSDGWILDISLGMVYPIEPGSIFGMAYEALSDTVFIWKPTEEELSDSAEDPNLEMRIIYSDPEGRFIVYSPNVEKPDLANVIINPDYLYEIVDESSKVTDKDYRYYYKIKDKGLKALSLEMDQLLSYDDYVKAE